MNEIIQLKKILNSCEFDYQKVRGFMTRWSEDSADYLRLMNRSLVLQKQCDELQKAIDELIKNKIERTEIEDRQRLENQIVKEQNRKLNVEQKRIADEKKEQKRKAHEALIEQQKEWRKLKEANK